jgi:hypothetical protein
LSSKDKRERDAFVSTQIQ